MRHESRTGRGIDVITQVAFDVDVKEAARWPLKPLVDLYWQGMTLYAVEEGGSVCRCDLSKPR